jgi:hypothetical protein
MIGDKKGKKKKRDADIVIPRSIEKKKTTENIYIY